MIQFLLNSVLLGIGLAMDAFSISMANGLHDPKMKSSRMLLIAGVFGGFQFAMPMIGWCCAHWLYSAFLWFQPAIPWIALILLLFIGGKMILESRKGEAEEADSASFSLKYLIIQGVATSIDALSVGFAIADYTTVQALGASLIIGIVTLGICCAGVMIGQKVGMKLSRKATLLGGIILILIGIEIFLTGVL